MRRQLCGFGLVALVASASAIAKDRPRDSPVRAPTGCEWAGPGFVRVEGSGTCVRVGGSVKAEYGGSFGASRPALWRR